MSASKNADKARMKTKTHPAIKISHAGAFEDLFWRVMTGEGTCDRSRKFRSTMIRDKSLAGTGRLC